MVLKKCFWVKVNSQFSHQQVVEEPHEEEPEEDR
jgi:hypothetical protein